MTYLIFTKDENEFLDVINFSSNEEKEAYQVENPDIILRSEEDSQFIFEDDEDIEDDFFSDDCTDVEW